MNTAHEITKSDLMWMATEIVSSFVGEQEIMPDEVPALFQKVFDSLVSLNNGQSAHIGATKPAVPVKKSITPDYIICLEDGKALKMLKRHLRTRYNMTPEEYRKKWNLPPDYPMVAPNYAKRRSEFAKQIGLGKLG